MVHVARLVTIPLALALAACASPPTQVVVRLATDMGVPDELNGIGLRILDGDGSEVRSQNILDLDPALADGHYHEIGTFGLVPQNGDAGRRFEVQATALVGGSQLFITRARSSFLRERTIRLDLYVPRLCVDVAATCQPDETCGVTGCVDPEIDPTELPSNEEVPPPDPVDPRPPVVPPPPVADAFRPLRPLLGERVSTQMPTVEVQVGTDVTAVVIEHCDDASCGTFRETTGSVGRLTVDPTQRIHYWRARGERGGATVRSPVYWYYTRAVDRSVDRTCGAFFDREGDGQPDLLVGSPGGTTGQAFLYPTSGAAPNTWTAIELGPPPGAVGFGASFATGDFDGDGGMEIVVGAPDSLDGGRIILYDAEALAMPRDAYEAGAVGVITQRFGFALGSIGDVNNDGYHDIAVAGLDATGRAVVEVWVGGPSGLEHAFVTPAYDSARVAIAGGGDIDGDLFDDFVIGLPDDPPGGTAWLFRGTADPSALMQLFAAPAGGAPPSSGYGTAVTFGDAAGDGRCDVVVSAADAGQLYMSVDGAAFADVPSTLFAGNGTSLAFADLDDDGLDDLVAAGTPIRGLLTMRLIYGVELPSPLMLDTLDWTMPNGAGAVVLGVLGDVGGADQGVEIVAAEEGFGFGVLADRFEVGNAPAPSGTMRFGAAVR
ncbi:MAG: VCBS repeat-containing protein [Myxococcales bacterium]|nr:VCBS repeat-containing protein [Myxococcales bacterium]